MKSFFRLVGVVVLVALVSVVVRVALHRVFPRFYGAVWGVGTPGVKTEPEADKGLAKKSDRDPSEPVAKEPLNPVFRDMPLEARGWLVGMGKAQVLLSDGSILTEKDAELTEIRRNSVTIAGKRYALKAAPRVEAPMPAKENASEAKKTGNAAIAASNASDASASGFLVGGSGGAEGEAPLLNGAAANGGATVNGAKGKRGTD
jgi:hypothetical protein